MLQTGEYCVELHAQVADVESSPSVVNGVVYVNAEATITFTL